MVDVQQLHANLKKPNTFPNNPGTCLNLINRCVEKNPPGSLLTTEREGN
jgi:hypothetical protein